MTQRIISKMPRLGLDGVKPGEIYERRLFPGDKLSRACLYWRLRIGTIKDENQHREVEVVQFVRRAQ